MAQCSGQAARLAHCSPSLRRSLPRAPSVSRCLSESLGWGRFQLSARQGHAHSGYGAGRGRGAGAGGHGRAPCRRYVTRRAGCPGPPAAPAACSRSSPGSSVCACARVPSYLRACMRMCVCACACVSVSVRVRACARVSECSSPRACVRACTYSYVACLRAFVRTRVRALVEAQSRLCARASPLWVSGHGGGTCAAWDAARLTRAPGSGTLLGGTRRFGKHAKKKTRLL